MAYETYVGPKLEYAAAIRNAHQIDLINHLESVQNRTARLILNDHYRRTRVSALKFQLYKSRHKISCLTPFHKIFYYNPMLHNPLLLPPRRASSRLNHPCHHISDHKLFQPIGEGERINFYSDHFSTMVSAKWKGFPLHEILYAALCAGPLLTNWSWFFRAGLDSKFSHRSTGGMVGVVGGLDWIYTRLFCDGGFLSLGTLGSSHCIEWGTYATE